MTAKEIDDVLANPEKFMVYETQAINVDEAAYQVPILALYDYIDKYGGKGTIIVTNDNNVDISINNNFTKEINYRREAARLYYDNIQSIQTIFNNAADSLMKAKIDEILQSLDKAKIDSIVQTKDFKAKVTEKAIKAKIITEFTDNFMESKLSTIFSKIQSDKDKVISKFFRTPPTSGPYPPKYYIERQYLKNAKGNYGSYLTSKVTQKNIDTYVTQRIEQYKK